MDYCNTQKKQDVEKQSKSAVGISGRQNMANFIRTKVDPNRLSTIASNINENIGQVERAIKLVKSTLSEGGGGSLKATWSGPASTVFYSQFNEDIEIFNSFLQILQTLNSQLSDAASIYDNAEKRVQELVNQLKIG